MPDQEQLDDFLEALEELGSPARKPALRGALGWDEPLYMEVKADLVSRGIVKRGRGRNDSVSLVGVDPVEQQRTPSSNGCTGKAPGNGTSKDKSLESWIWDAACSIRGATDAPKYKDYILPLIFTKRLCDVFDDELNRIAAEVGSRKKAFALVKADPKLVRFYLPLVPDAPEQPVWSVIRKLAGGIGEGVTTHMRAIARENPPLQGIIDRVDFNATTHGQRDLDNVEADIIGKSYEYLIRKFAEGGGQSAGEFYTPPEVGTIMSRALQPEPGMTVYDPCRGSGGLHEHDHPRHGGPDRDRRHLQEPQVPGPARQTPQL